MWIILSNHLNLYYQTIMEGWEWDTMDATQWRHNFCGECDWVNMISHSAFWIGLRQEIKSWPQGIVSKRKHIHTCIAVVSEGFLAGVPFLFKALHFNISPFRLVDWTFLFLQPPPPQVWLTSWLRNSYQQILPHAGLCAQYWDTMFPTQSWI